jgi:hypothetical protein
VLHQSASVGCTGAWGTDEKRNDCIFSIDADRKATDRDYPSLRLAIILDMYCPSLGNCQSFPSLNAGKSGVVRPAGLF